MKENWLIGGKMADWATNDRLKKMADEGMFQTSSNLINIYNLNKIYIKYLILTKNTHEIY